MNNTDEELCAWKVSIRSFECPQRPDPSCEHDALSKSVAQPAESEKRLLDSYPFKSIIFIIWITESEDCIKKNLIMYVSGMKNLKTNLFMCAFAQ